MAAHHKCVKYIEETLDFAKHYDYGCEWSRVCQLGSCGFRRSAKTYLYRKYGINFRKLNGYLKHRDFEVITIDIAGKKRELCLDLSKPIRDIKLLGQFDFVISFATIEHIEDQYMLFENIHNLCKVGGVIIVNGPVVGTYEGHSTWKYDFEFFENLFYSCGYAIFDARITSLKYAKLMVDKLTIYASYSKIEGSRFVEREDFKLPHYDPAGHEQDKRTYDGCKRSEKVV